MKTIEIQNEGDVNQVRNNVLVSCIPATRCAVNGVLKCSPGSLVFQRDVLVGFLVIANLLAIGERRELLLDKNLRRQNPKQYDYYYKVGEHIHIKIRDPSKSGDEILHGPYRVLEAKINGTVEVQVGPEGNITEHLILGRYPRYQWR